MSMMRYLVCLLATSQLLHSTPLSTSSVEDEIETSVVILGGGLAGVFALERFQKLGMRDIILVEGRDTLGGRLQNTKFADYTIELGANWVHGTVDNPIWDLAKKWNLYVTYSNYSDLTVYYDHKQTQSFVDEEERYDTAWEDARKVADSLNNTSDIPASQGLSHAGWDPKTPIQQAVEYYDFDFEYSKPAVTSSLDFVALNSECSAGNSERQDYFVVDPRGYSSIITKELQANRISLNDPRIFLSTVVNKIEYSNDGVTVYTTDNKCIKARLGVLKGGDVQFEPPLPQWKRRSIDKFDFGLYLKIFLSFPYKFWDDTQFIISAENKPGYYSIWQSLDMPGFYPDSHLLFVTVTDELARQVELQSDQETLEQALEVLKTMYPDAPNPTDIFYPRWTQNPLFRGSYSNWPIGYNMDMHDDLRRNVGNLHFAGEATSTVCFGFAQGALTEGVNKASEIFAELN